MDDDYDMDEIDESDELDEDEDFDDEEDAEDFDRDFDGGSFDGGRDLMELEELGVMDGQQDAISGSFYTGFGMSVDFDDLSDEEREAYETGYHTGYGAGGGWQ